MKRNFAKISTEQGTIKSLFKFASFVLTKPGFELVKKIAKKALRKVGLYKEIHHNYNDWIAGKLDIRLLKKEYYSEIRQFSIQPVFSIIIPVYNPPIQFLIAAIESVTSQLYGKWELCLADDVSPNPEVRKILNEYAARDKRIKVIFREVNGHISANTNSALSLATGDLYLFMDHDDLLTPNCLFEFVKHINAHPEDEVIYSDEDKIDDKGELSSPHFKPDWAPDNLLSRNYMGHVIVVSKNIMAQVKEFRLGYEGSQDHDFLLRATECTKHIGHIPKVLYHWRIHQASVASGGEAKPYAFIAAQKALEDALERRNTPGTVTHIPETLGGYRMNYKVTKPGKVSVIIPTKDQVALLKGAIDSMLTRTKYPDFEIIVLNNNSTSPEFFQLMEEYKQSHGDIFSCIECSFKFNFAKLMNIGVAHSKGEYILLANNDIEVIQDDWMTEMVSFAQRPHTGAVGVKLLYKDDTIQHAGVVLGLGGAAGHVFVNMHRNDRGYYNYVRSLNNYSAVTAACVMCRKEVYNEVGGMDEMLDVEYNDVDLCLKFLTHGYFNVYVPDVEVYHYESATRGHPFQSKEAWAQHEKDFGIFRGKWQKLIDNDPFYNPNLSVYCTDFQLKIDIPGAPDSADETRSVRPGKHVLVVHTEAPNADRDAESHSMSNIIDMLVNLGCDVSFWAPGLSADMPEVQQLIQKKVEVLYGDEYASPTDGWKDHMASHIDDINIVLLSRPSVSRPIVEYLREQRYGGSIVYYGHDLGFVTAGREAAANGDASLMAMAEAVKVDEFFMYHSADRVLLTSEEDMAYMKANILTPVHLIPEYYFQDDETPAPFDNRKGIVYIGGFGHLPNTDAIHWFLDEVYAGLEEKGIHLTIAGDQIPESVFAYKRRFPSLTLLPNATAATINELYTKARVAIAPMRLGADIRESVLKAMAKGLPVSGTDNAFEGMVKDNELAYKGYNSPRELLENILLLYSDKAAWERLSRSGKSYVRQHYSKDNMKEAFKKAFRNM